MARLNILLTGATGYIGGSVLSTFLSSKYEFLNNHNLSVLVRAKDQADFFASKGLTPYIFKGFEDLEGAETAAAQHDIVIHTASGYHPELARAFVTGLGKRRRQTGRDVHYIHTGGVSNLANQPISGHHPEKRIFSDKRDNVYVYEKMRDEKEPYGHRTSDIVATETGKEYGVKTTVIFAPTVYGIGTGFYNTQSIQIPILIKAAIKAGQAEMIAEGTGVWGYVHIVDLAKLYEIVLARLVNGESIPNGEYGLFCASGRYTWRELTQYIADAAFKAGVIPTREIKSISLQEAADKWLGSGIVQVETGYASDAVTEPDTAREWGWVPEKTAQDFHASFDTEVAMILLKQGYAKTAVDPTAFVVNQ